MYIQTTIPFSFYIDGLIKRGPGYQHWEHYQETMLTEWEQNERPLLNKICNALTAATNHHTVEFKRTNANKDWNDVIMMAMNDELVDTMI